MGPYDWYLYSDNYYYPMTLPDNVPDNWVDSTQYCFDWDCFRPMGDPPPILSNAPASTSIAIVQRKELTGYPNYGNPSGNADILYTGNRGTWTFTLPPFIVPTFNRPGRISLIIRGALDDHYNVPENRYSMAVSFNGVPQNVGRLPFVHGSPSGQRFTNWTNLNISLPANLVRRNNSVVIRNTSNTGDTDFIAFDWMELRYML